MAPVTTPDPVDPKVIMKRRLIHDLLPCGTAEQMLHQLGMVQASAEGTAIEHRQSHIRLMRLTPIIDMVKMISSLAGEVQAEGILVTHEGVPELTPEEFKQVLVGVAVNSTMGVMANMMDPSGTWKGIEK